MFSDSSGTAVADQPTEAPPADTSWLKFIDEKDSAADFARYVADFSCPAASPAGPRHQNPHRKFPRIYTYQGRHREAE